MQMKGGEYMNIKLIKRSVILLLLSVLFVSNFFVVTPKVFAAAVTAHVRLVGSNRTIWFGDVTYSGCTITDDANVNHVYTTPLAVCAIDAASNAGGFTYKVHDFGGSLGLFLQAVAEDQG